MLYISLLLLGTACAQDDTKELIQRLSSDNPAERQTAADALVKLGEKAESAVEPLTKSEDPDLKGQATAILARIRAAKLEKELATRLAERRKALADADVSHKNYMEKLETSIRKLKAEENTAKNKEELEKLIMQQWDEPRRHKRTVMPLKNQIAVLEMDLALLKKGVTDPNERLERKFREVPITLYFPSTSLDEILKYLCDLLGATLKVDKGLSLSTSMGEVMSMKGTTPDKFLTALMICAPGLTYELKDGRLWIKRK